MPTREEAVAALGAEGNYLDKCGCIRSYMERRPVTKEGEPLPWYSYAATYFLQPLLSPCMQVFEYGCGYSTKWYAARVKEVRAVEHNQKWIDHLGQLPPNVAINLATTVDRYSNMATEYNMQEGGIFDIVCIDGEWRNECTEPAIKALNRDGVIVYDNADSFKAACKVITEHGFSRLDFWGLIPICTYPVLTSIFYRRNNCLGI